MVLTPVLYRYHLGIIYCDINQRHILIHASFHSVQIRFQAHHWHIFNALFFQHQQYAFAPFLDDGAAEEQQDKTKMSHLILKRCRMVVVCGKEVSGTMNAEISMADRLHIICTTLDGLIKIKEAE